MSGTERFVRIGWFRGWFHAKTAEEQRAQRGRSLLLRPLPRRVRCVKPAAKPAVFVRFV